VAGSDLSLFDPFQERFIQCQEPTELATVARSFPVRVATSSCVK